MRLLVARFLLLAVITGLITLYTPGAGQRLSGLGATPPGFSIDVALDPGEILVGAAAGLLVAGGDPVLVFGTIRNGGGNVRVFHRRGNRYSEAWRFTNDLGGFDSAIISDVTNSHQYDLVTLWRGGNGGYLDVRVFEWRRGTYRELWNLYRHVKDGQLTEGAGLLIEPIDNYGNVQLVVRAPNLPQGSGAHGPVAHQVSVYRWDATKQTFRLFQRFIDSKPSLQ
jgi:hypothetical protein